MSCSTKDTDNAESAIAYIVQVVNLAYSPSHQVRQGTEGAAASVAVSEADVDASKRRTRRSPSPSRSLL